MEVVTAAGTGVADSGLAVTVEAAGVADLEAVASAGAVAALVVAGLPEAGKGPFPDENFTYAVRRFQMQTS